MAVFPTPVGVFLKRFTAITRSLSLPHARGGVSILKSRQIGATWSSPRPWGCFGHQRNGDQRAGVFPTPVGVFPSRSSHARRRTCLPHARGGVSPAGRTQDHSRWSSPRPWGCFYRRAAVRKAYKVFPTPVGVFPTVIYGARGIRGLPHARGGVSVVVSRNDLDAWSSPRPWGCFF